MKLSILIATLESRKDQFNELCAHIQKQLTPEAEVLFSSDRGQASIGSKRQSLLMSAKGDFVVYVDDDDKIAEDYVPKVLEHCNDGIDCIGYPIACYGYVSGQPYKLERAIVSNRFNEWKTNPHNDPRYERCPHHLVPIRREHALKVGFDVKSRHGEDAVYSFGLRDKGLLKNEAFIPEYMYTIYHVPGKKFGQ